VGRTFWSTIKKKDNVAMSKGCVPKEAGRSSLEASTAAVSGNFLTQDVRGECMGPELVFKSEM
jgi:hypothetical protein